MPVFPTSNGATSPLRSLGGVAVCILVAATLFACTSGGEDFAGDERAIELEAKVHSLEESLEALGEENVQLKGEIAMVGERLDDLDARFRELEEVTPKVELGFH